MFQIKIFSVKNILFLQIEKKPDIFLILRDETGALKFYRASGSYLLVNILPKARTLALPSPEVLRELEKWSCMQFFGCRLCTFITNTQR